MYVKRVKKGNGIVSIRIVESIRRPNGKGIQNKTIKYVGQSKDSAELQALEKAASEIIYLRNLEKDKIEKIRSISSRVDASLPLSETVEVARVNDGIFEIFGQVYDQLGLNSLITETYKDEQWNKILKALILSRISSPDSKKKTAEVLSKDYFFNIPLEKFYRTMDRLLPFELASKELILNKTKQLHNGEISIMLFDVTTLYFESFEKDELRNNGFSKDCKFKEVQIVLSLMTTDTGLPVGYKLFPGHTSEGTTLLTHLLEMKSFYKLKKLTLIADRAMFTRQNLSTLEENGIKYIVAAKLKGFSLKKRNEILSDNKRRYSLRVNEDTLWVKNYDHEKRRLIVSYSHKRAEKDKKMRERLLARIKPKNQELNEKINVSVNKLIANNGTKKFFKSKGKTLELDNEKIAEDAKWDGLHGIITNDKKTSSFKLLKSYRMLWKIEEAFRINKNDLKMRPIYHWKKERIESHILICYIAFAVATFTMRRINSHLEKKISLKACTEELIRVESSILKNKSEKNKNLYILPAALTANQTNIYAAIGVTRSPNIRRIVEN